MTFTTLLLPIIFLLGATIYFIIYNIRDTRRANNQNRPKVKYAWLWILALFLVSEYSLFIGDIPQLSYPELFLMKSSSMENTVLFGDGLAVKSIKRLSDIENGDLVIFYPPQNDTLKWLSRCVAKAGQTIEIRDKKVFVDGNLVPLPTQAKNFDSAIFAYDKFTQKGIRDNLPLMTIPAGCFFVMGDNRDYSIDSRYFGVISESLLVAKPRVIFYSMDKSLTDIRWDRIGIKLNGSD
jgi:signal peptidase I